jgi:dihydrofolate reductase
MNESSSHPHLALVAALDRNRLIGRGNQMPWHLPEDLRHFKALTMGAPVIMGRKTYVSVLGSLGRPLPGRRNLVISRGAALPSDHGEVAQFPSLDAALDAARPAARAFVIGGGEIYALAITRADSLHLTEIDAEFIGDTYFPRFSRDDWLLRSRDVHEQSTAPYLRYAFCDYVRV